MCDVEFHDAKHDDLARAFNRDAPPWLSDGVTGITTHDAAHGLLRQWYHRETDVELPLTARAADHAYVHAVLDKWLIAVAAGQPITVAVTPDKEPTHA
jgi:hypothetical protein